MLGLQPTSFLLGLGAAWAFPYLGRVLRPIAVQATAAGMSMFEDLRRVVAEQMEIVEDIAAEARAKREEMASAEADSEDTQEERAEPQPARRRANGARRRAS